MDNMPFGSLSRKNSICQNYTSFFFSSNMWKSLVCFSLAWWIACLIRMQIFFFRRVVLKNQLTLIFFLFNISWPSETHRISRYISGACHRSRRESPSRVPRPLRRLFRNRTTASLIRAILITPSTMTMSPSTRMTVRPDTNTHTLHIRSVFFSLRGINTPIII